MMSWRIDKRQKYLINALLFGIYILLVTSKIISISLVTAITIGFVLVIAGVLYSHYPNVSFTNSFMSMILPVHLLAGSLVSFTFFPNLGLAFKVVVTLVYTFLFYLVCLVDNIFLVVSDREEAIPLYRVATTWGQILLVIIAIPLFAGIFKIPENVLFQIALVTLTSFLFSLYQIWTLTYDNKSKKTRVGETILLCALVGFVVFASTLAVSFIPTEPFLRALFISSILMFGLVYTNGYLKNEITSKMLLEYFIIILIFFVLLVSFGP